MGLVQVKAGIVAASSLTITLDNPTGSGHGLVVMVATSASSSNGTVSGVTLGGSADNFASAATAGSVNDVAFEYCWADLNCASGQTSVVISTTGAVGTQHIAAWVYEFDNLPLSAGFDKSAGTASTTTWSSGSTAALAQASEVAFGLYYVIGASAPTITGPSSPWVNQAQQQIGSDSSMSGYDILSSTSAVAYAGTVSGATDGTALVATFKLAAAAIPVLPARPGRTWQRRFRHPQILPPVPPAVAAAAPAPLMRPVITSRLAARARVGPSGASPGGGIAGPAPVAAVPVPSRPFIARSAAPRRARTGPAGAPGDGVASAIVTPLGVPSRPRPFVFRSPAPARARTGPAASNGDGIASAIITPLGSMPRPMPRPVIQHLPAQRGQAGPLGLPGAGLASGIVTPRGTPGPGWRPQPRRPGPARAQWHGNAGPAAVAPAAPQAYQHPPAQARRPAPARAVWHGQAGPANAAPVTTAAPRPPAQPRSRPPQRAVWHGNASRIVTPLGTPARRPGPVITSRPRNRGQWHGNTGPAPIASAPPPRWKPLPSRRKPQRGTWRHIAGTANLAPPPPPTFGTALAAIGTVSRALDGTGTAPRALDGTGPAASTPSAASGTTTTPRAQDAQQQAARAQQGTYP